MRTAQNFVRWLIGAVEHQRKSETPAAVPDILAVLHDSRLAAALRGVVLPGAWRLEVASSLEAALERAAQHPFNTVILDRTIAASDWCEAVQLFSRLPSRPVVLLMSDRHTDGVWADLIRSGGYDLLGLPLEIERAKSTIYAGWLFWHNQDHLRQLTK